jgi:integrase
VASSTRDRWRLVFGSLDEQPWSHPEFDAQAWIDGLITPERTAGTVRRTWLAACKSVFRWAVRKKKLAANPFADVVVTVPRKIVSRETSRSLTMDEATIILRAAFQVTKLPAVPSETAACRRWVPWLCAYSGARVVEVTQLRAGDIEQRPEGWVMKIDPAAGTVKTGKARVVPLHEHLIAQGFLKFVQTVRDDKGPGGALFYNDSTPSRGKSREPTSPARSWPNGSVSGA